MDGGDGGNADHQIRTLPMEGRGELSDRKFRCSALDRTLRQWERSEAMMESEGRRWRFVMVIWTTPSCRRRIW